MSEISKCPNCGAPASADAPEGLCPRCLVAMNLATQTEIPGETGPHGTKIVRPPLPVEEVAKLFPRLEILECLGRGGMGAVYKARQPRLDRLVALKILSPEKQGETKFAERFEREARALAKLHHPNIITIYDFGETQGNFYLLMEFVDGLTLRQLFQARKLSPAEALGIVPKICEALQYAHEQGIVHRDIKPENILLDKNGAVKIADFGIAKILGNDGGRANLTEEQAIGTPHYMSPEQIEKPQTVDHRADIYSLGVVFYEMLTGELPLGKFSPPSKKVHIDVRLDEIVLRALEKEPERRYQQVSEVKTQVETIAATPESSRRRGDESQTEGQKSRADWKSTSLSDIEAVREVGGFLKRIFLGVSFGLLALLLAFLVFAFYQRAHRAPFNSVKSDYIGQMWFPQGDSIEITSVERTKNQLTVKGHYHLVSHDKALLALYITTTNDIAVPTDLKQEMDISKGRGVFELTHSRVVPGLPHVNMYAANGKPFAEIYFGTKSEAAEASKLGLNRDDIFRPVIERTLIDQMAIDFDSGKVVADLWREAQRNGFTQNHSILDHVAYMKSAGLDASVVLETPVLQITPQMIYGKTRPMLSFIAGMKMEKIDNSCWNEMNVSQLKRFLESVETNSLTLQGLGNLNETNLPATYGFETRDANCGILQITSFTSDNPPAMKIRYKLAQSSALMFQTKEN